MVAPPVARKMAAKATSPACMRTLGSQRARPSSRTAPATASSRTQCSGVAAPARATAITAGRIGEVSIGSRARRAPRWARLPAPTASASIIRAATLKKTKPMTTLGAIAIAIAAAGGSSVGLNAAFSKASKILPTGPDCSRRDRKSHIGVHSSKSILPSLLNGVIRATNEPSIFIFGMVFSRA